MAKLSAMRSNEIFAAMSGGEALSFLEEMRESAPDVAKLALAAAAEAFRLRPEFLKRQPRPRQAEWMRRALGRTVGARLAEEVLATYFLEHEKDLLIELLDTLGVPHEEGRLEQENPPPPGDAALAKGVEKFKSGTDAEKRLFLLRSFAAQSAIDWPALDVLMEGGALPAAPAKTSPARKPAAVKAKPRAKAKAKPKSVAKAKAKKKTKAARKKR